MTARAIYTRDDGVVMIEVAKGQFVRLYTAYLRGLISEAEYEAALNGRSKDLTR